MMIQEEKDVRLGHSAKEVWVQAQAILAQKLNKPTFETWIRPAQLLEISGDEVLIGVCNEFMRSWIFNYHMESIAEAISQVLKRRISAKLIVEPNLQHESYTPSIAAITVIPQGSSCAESQPLDKNTRSNFPVSVPTNAHQHREKNDTRIAAANLNPKYTFETFVIGSHNRFCHSAAMAVAERPGQAYNPLFIYGGVGLGKTHIMQAIGQQILKHSPQTAVRYMSCERFTNELINSIRDDRTIDFRKRYRQVDVLLMDDIQFIEGKESTQEEFFHTFNALRDSGRQIIVSSDRP
ncbi:MAG: ATP-binding protein, partial [Candidatus Melainabacteria bacterium]|nr:ATP-binding protein [Candidatus Melainabacteria bacterium]